MKNATHNAKQRYAPTQAEKIVTWLTVYIFNKTRHQLQGLINLRWVDFPDQKQADKTDKPQTFSR